MRSQCRRQSPIVTPRLISCRQGKPKNDRSCGPGISGHPGTHHHARRSAAGDASPGTRHLLRPDGAIDRKPARRSLKTVRHQGPILHLHRQRPWRLGSDAFQRAVARRQAAGAGKRALCDRLGPGGGGDGRRGRGAQGRLAPRDPSRRGRGAAEAGQGSQHQGDRRGAGRYGVWRL